MKQNPFMKIKEIEKERNRKGKKGRQKEKET
jgi:hypothetical protein